MCSVFNVVRVRIAFTFFQVFFGLLGHQAIFFLDPLQVLMGELFNVHHFIMRTLGRADDLVKLELNGNGVAMLAVLNDKKHADGNDRRQGADHKLPCIVKMHGGSEQPPNQNNKKCPEARQRVRGFVGKPFCDHGEIFHKMLF